MGRPMEMASIAPGSTFQHVDQTVVSVGPYMFQTSAASREELACELARQWLAADQRSQRRRARPSRIDENSPGRRRGLHERRASRVDEIAQHAPIGELIAARNDHLGTDRQGKQQLEDGDVEAQRCDGEQAIRLGDPGHDCHAAQKVRDGRVQDLNAFRFAGRSRRVDDIRGIVRRRVQRGDHSP